MVRPLWSLSACLIHFCGLRRIFVKTVDEIWQIIIIIIRSLNGFSRAQWLYQNRTESKKIKSRVGFFGVRGENRSARGETAHSRVENQQTQSTTTGRKSNPWALLVEGECSHQCASPTVEVSVIAHLRISKSRILTSVGSRSPLSSFVNCVKLTMSLGRE